MNRTFVCIILASLKQQKQTIPYELFCIYSTHISGSSLINRLIAKTLIEVLSLYIDLEHKFLVNGKNSRIHLTNNGDNMTKAFSVASWNVKHFKSTRARVDRAMSFLKKQDPDKWGPAVAGTVDEGETYEQNIVKEAEEELGLKGIKFEKGPKERVKGKYNYFCQWYILKTDKDISEFKIQEDEVSEIRWWTKKELKESNSELFISSMKQHIKLFLE